MTLGEKLAKLRREKGYTQEDLADRLGVSRQSVSKWESDAAYPETEKLLRLGELYDCSMDYLLKDGEPSSGYGEAGGGTEPAARPFDLKSFYFERKSKTTIGGLPLWHVNIGLGRTAKGIFAVGLCAKGIVSVGVLSLGVVSLGCLSLGLLAIGSFALGGIAAGAVALGLIALGAVALGLLAVGAVAIGEFSVGALAVGNYLAVGDTARGAIAVGFSEATGTLLEADALTGGVRERIVSLLNETVPSLLSWLKGLLVLFL